MSKQSNRHTETARRFRENILIARKVGAELEKEQREAYVFSAQYEVTADGQTQRTQPLTRWGEIGVDRDLSPDAVALADSIAKFRAVALKESESGAKENDCSLGIEIHVYNGCTTTTVTYVSTQRD